MKELFSTWYRSLTPDGKVWCESADPVEVAMPHPRGLPLTFEKMEIRKVSEGWKAWDQS